MAVTVLFATLMWLLAQAMPGSPLQLSLPLAWRLAASALLIASSAAIGLAGVWSFRQARTTVNPLNPERSTALVVDGVYRYSRNPMYLALLLALLGWGLFLANALSVVMALAFIPWMNRFQIGPEERVLQRAYGRAFDDYRRRVRRWL